jgi:hypothetical protein
LKGAAVGGGGGMLRSPGPPVPPVPPVVAPVPPPSLGREVVAPSRSSSTHPSSAWPPRPPPSRFSRNTDLVGRAPVGCALALPLVPLGALEGGPDARARVPLPGTAAAPEERSGTSISMAGPGKDTAAAAATPDDGDVTPSESPAAEELAAALPCLPLPARPDAPSLPLPPCPNPAEGTVPTGVPARTAVPSRRRLAAKRDRPPCPPSVTGCRPVAPHQTHTAMHHHAGSHKQCAWKLT